jgi:hypothetical protein
MSKIQQPTIKLGIAQEQSAEKPADARWMAPWRANAASRADQTRLVAKSAVTETGHTLKPDGTFGCTDQGNCPKHGQLEELYSEVRAHTDKALEIARKRDPKSTDHDNKDDGRKWSTKLWQRYKAWQYQLGTGSVRDAVYGHIHLADCALVDIITESQLWGELPRIKSVVDGSLATDHESRIWLDQLFDDLRHQEKKARLSPANQEGSTGGTARELIGEQERFGILSALRTAYLQSAVNRNSLLSLQKMMRTISILLSIMLVTLAIIGVFWSNVIPLCTDPAGKGFCPVGTRPSGWDIFLVELIGVFAATLAGGLTLLGRHEPDIFQMRYSQLALKATAGGATALFGLVLLLPIVANTIPVSSSLAILAFAGILGYSEQAFTRMVDSRVDVLRRSVKPPSTSTPIELSQNRSSMD